MRKMRSVALVTGLLVLVAGAAIAGLPGYGYSILYFDEFGEVGGATAPCQGFYTSWGIRTSNYQKYTWRCPED